MNCEKSLWRDEFIQYTFEFEGRKALLIFPKADVRTDKWLLKTEYFDAFQDFEYAMVKRGFHLAYLQNHNRWATDDDLDAKFLFRNFLVREFGLSPKCVPVGMSCGGLHAIKQAARHPEMISAFFLDAPVVNLLSCPFHLSAPSDLHEAIQQEALNALGMTLSDLLAYRDHPLDHIPKLIENRFPMLLICGGADQSVDFKENGLFLKRAHEATDIPFRFIFYPERGHHPHGPSEKDMEQAAEFICSVG